MTHAENKEHRFFRDRPPCGESRCDKSRNRTLATCLEGVTLSRSFLNTANRTGKIVGSKLNKPAILGIDGVAKSLLVKSFAAFTKLNVKTFLNEPDAIDWLVR